MKQKAKNEFIFGFMNRNGKPSMLQLILAWFLFCGIDASIKQ